jgi:hypothetical protein
LQIIKNDIQLIWLGADKMKFCAKVMQILLLITIFLLPQNAFSQNREIPIIFNVDSTFNCNEFGDISTELIYKIVNNNDSSIELDYECAFENYYYNFSSKAPDYLKLHIEPGSLKIAGILPPKSNTEIIIKYTSVENPLMSHNYSKTVRRQTYNTTNFLFNNTGNYKLGEIKVKIIYPNNKSIYSANKKAYIEVLNRKTKEIIKYDVDNFSESNFNMGLLGDISTNLNISYTTYDIYYYIFRVLVIVLIVALMIALYLYFVRVKNLVK